MTINIINVLIIYILLIISSFMYNSNNNYIQKSNYLELKTLEYYFWWDYKKAKSVFNIRHKLNSRWFELYIKYYLKKLWFNMSSFTWWLKADWWIDLKWINPPLYVQCKKYLKNNNYKWIISIWDMRNFYGWVVSLYNWNIQNKNIIMLFATTWSYTHSSKDFAMKSNIDLFDYKDIWNISEYYSLEDFLEEFKNKWYKVENILNKEYIQVEMNQLSFNYSDLQESDILLFLKNIRENIVSIINIDEKETWIILSDNTLKEIANKRISNIWWLKEYLKNFNNEYEEDHIYKYGKELIKWLEILKK